MVRMPGRRDKEHKYLGRSTSEVKQCWVRENATGTAMLPVKGTLDKQRARPKSSRSKRRGVQHALHICP
eukprot:3922615-Amphidinium_carterae.1